MAEIHIERKSSRIWWWALLGVALLLLATCVVAWWRGSPVTTMTGGAPGTGAAASGTVAPTLTDTAGTESEAVAAYLSYVEANRARQAAGPAHDYTADGLRRLAAAIAELSERNAGAPDVLRGELSALRAQADSLQSNPQSTEHARLAREAFRTAAALMSTLQQRYYANVAGEVREVRRAAESLSRAQPLLDQTAAIQRFFDRSAATLRAMAGARS